MFKTLRERGQLTKLVRGTDWAEGFKVYLYISEYK
jgi:hypothetical protein